MTGQPSYPATIHRRMRVEIEHDAIRMFHIGGIAPPRMELEHFHLHQLEQSLRILDAQMPIRLGLAANFHAVHVTAHTRRQMLLEKTRLIGTVGATQDGQRSTADPGQYPRCDGTIVIRHVLLGQFESGVDDPLRC